MSRAMTSQFSFVMTLLMLFFLLIYFIEQSLIDTNFFVIFYFTKIFFFLIDFQSLERNGREAEPPVGEFSGTGQPAVRYVYLRRR